MVCQPCVDYLDSAPGASTPSIQRSMASKSSDNMNRLISGLFLRPTVCGVCEGRAQSSACLTCPIGADPIATEILSFSFSFLMLLGDPLTER